jgi:hypothetical protein
MRRLASVLVGLGFAVLGGCTPSGLPILPPAKGPLEPGALASHPETLETSLIASGSPIDIYAQLARGILNCWFGADGPLKRSHIFHAEAESATAGGAAEIVLQERDITLRDQRGVRAYRIQITNDAAGARVVATSLKMDLQRAKVMAKDVEVWAKGGSGCQLAVLFPPPLPPDPPKAKAPAKGKGKPQR